MSSLIHSIGIDMIIIFFVFVILSRLPLFHSATPNDNSMPICPANFTCPALTTFKYPFYNGTETRCGLIKVNCTAEGGEIQIRGKPYMILSKFDYGNSSRLFLWDHIFEGLVNNKSCEALMNNFTSPSPRPLLYSISIVDFIYLFKCQKNLTYFKQHKYNSYTGCKDHNFYYNYSNTKVPSDLPHTCQVVQLPVNTPSALGFNESNIFSLLYPGTSTFFDLSHSCSKCQDQNRSCRIAEGVVQCFDVKKGRKLHGKIYASGRKLHGKIYALVVGLGVGIITTLVIIILCLRRKIEMRKNVKYNFKVEMFLKNHEFLAPKRYSYPQVKKITNSFNVKLGKGGFGTVYKGVLKNQNPVAVKVLSEIKGDGEDFINEVASVGRTSHVNIVSLLGFCLEGRKRVLIYEFMPNGSLERFIYSHGSSSSSRLGWEKLHQIAIGIARGLEYLYRGCSTRILHFDIKPHNILLDNDFCPKISDFGMAKLFREKESKISVSHMRGTPGYIAPELFSRNFGEVSHK